MGTPVPARHPEELVLISEGSLPLIPFTSRQQALTVPLCARSGLGAVSTIRGVSCLFWEIRYEYNVG